jgi:hypothetical protein
MSMRIGGVGTPVPPEQIDERQRDGKAAAAAEGPALTVDTAKTGARQGTGGPLGIEELLPTPDFAAQRRVLTASGAAGASQTEQAGAAEGQYGQGSDLAAKIDPNTANSNAAVAAMVAAGWAMIQAQQTSAKAEDTERKSDLQSYETQMDSAVTDLRNAATDTWNAALTEGITGIIGGVVGMAGAGFGAFGNSAAATFLGGSGDNPGVLGLTGNIIGMGGKIGGASFTQDATNKEADEKSAEKFAGVFQSATQNAAQYRDTYFQAQTTVIQAMQQIAQAEGAAKESAASGRA